MNERSRFGLRGNTIVPDYVTGECLYALLTVSYLIPKIEMTLILLRSNTVGGNLPNHTVKACIRTFVVTAVLLSSLD